MSSVYITPRGVVRCCADLDIPVSVVSVWGQLRDFNRFARQDLFHAEVSVEGGVPRTGAKLALAHRYAGVRVGRVGRILIWREGEGFTYSDLSQHGARRGFPHIFGYRLQPLSPRSCRLHIEVRGLWTARLVPRWAARLWLWWVFSQVLRSVGRELLLFQLWRARRQATVSAQ